MILNCLPAGCFHRTVFLCWLGYLSGADAVPKCLKQNLAETKIFSLYYFIEYKSMLLIQRTIFIHLHFFLCFTSFS